MQANDNKYQPNEKLTNEGWDAMHHMLDKEMPIEKKKRRGFFWLFFYLGIGIIGSVLVFYPNTPMGDLNKNLNPKVDKNSAVVNSVKTSTENFEIKKNLKIQDKKSMNFENIKPLKANSDNEIIEKTVKGKVEIIASERNIEEGVFDFKNTNKKNEVFYNNTNTKNKTVSQFAIGTVEERIKIDIEKLESNFLLSHKTKTTELVVKENATAFNNKEDDEIIIQPSRKIEYIAHVGALLDFSNVKQLGGFGALDIHFPINKKIGFRTGFGYSIIKKNVLYYFSDVQSASFLDASTTTSNQVVLVNTNTSFLLEEMHFIDIPFVLTYEHNRKFQSQLGFNFASLVKDKLVGVNSGASISHNDPALGIYSIDDLDLSEVSYDNYLEENFWNELNINSVVGLQWKFNSKWNLEIQYHYRWYDLLKESDDGAFDLINADNNVANQYYVNEALSPSGVTELSNDSFFNNASKSSIRLSIGYKF